MSTPLTAKNAYRRVKARGGLIFLFPIPPNRRFITPTIIIIVLFLFPFTAHAATLKELQDQLKKAEESLSRYRSLQEKEQTKAEQYSQDIETTQTQISSVKNTIASLESNISQKEGEINATAGQIDEKTTELNRLNNEKNDGLATYFELTNLNEVQMVADNQSLSHYVDQTEYLNALQDRIIGNIEQSSQVKQDLETTKAAFEQQKNELAALKGEQVAKNAELSSAQKKNYSLYNKTKANAAEYQAAAKKLESEKYKLNNDIYELRKLLSRKNNEIYAGGTSGYPYSAIHAADPWMFLTRECTSYAAWKWNVVYGREFVNTRIGSGHAYNWSNIARDQGYHVTSRPQETAIISWPAGILGGYGHVAIVEKVNGDGTIDVSEYNYNKYAYSYRKNVRYWEYGTASFIVP